MADPTFSVGGLATGLDTQTLVDKLVSLESRPLTLLRNRQAAYKSQVSALGDLASKLSALKTAATNLSTGGVLGAKTTSTNTAFSATPGSQAVAGNYDVQVTALAAPAKWLSAAFAATDTVKKGTLTITANGGTPTQIAVADNATLQDVAFAIRASGAPVSAVVLSDDLGTHLSLTATGTGFTGSDPTKALELSFAADPAATGTKEPGFTNTQLARNATFTIDGLPFTRQSNTVTDALPGTTLSLLVSGGAGETLSIANDIGATSTKLQTFVAAYNAVMAAVQKQLNVTKDTDRAQTLVGDSAVRSLEQSLQAISTALVDKLGTVRSLADLGIETARDGSLSIDSDTLAGALARDAAAVNTVFSEASTGIAKRISDLADGYTAPATGLITVRQSGLQSQIASMDDQATNMQSRIDAYRAGLVAQFTAMETTVSQLKNIGSFLTSQSSQSK